MQPTSVTKLKKFMRTKYTFNHCFKIRSHFFTETPKTKFSYELLKKPNSLKTESNKNRDFDRDLRNICFRKNIPIVDYPTRIVLKYCPTCTPHKNRADNIYKLNVWKNIGGYYCHRCQSKGNYESLRRNLLSMGSNFGTNSTTLKLFQNEANDQLMKKIQSEKNRESIEKILNKSIQNWKDNPNKLGPIEARKITKETVEKFCVGVTDWRFFDQKNDVKITEETIVFPWFTKLGHMVKCCRLKARSFRHKHLQRVYPKGGSYGLFGYNMIEVDDTEVVLTEGEFDAMAVYQETKIKSLSLPNGCNSLPVELIELFDQFKKIYIWFDDDSPGQDAAEKFSKKLGIERCHIISKNFDKAGNLYKDANDLLIAGGNLKDGLRSAAVVPHQQVASFTELKDAIFHEIVNAKKKIGTKFISLPLINKLLHGHRSGELTIFSGSTGIGKTTFLSQLSLDLAVQGVSTLWGSFEIKPSKLGKLMMGQYNGKQLGEDPLEFEKIAEKFGELPLKFLKFFGSTTIEEVIEAMEYANYVYDTKHIILDNLQFMLGNYTQLNRLDKQDQAISLLREFATENNVHITIVIHPRKEQDDVEIGVSSIFGTAKATQEADNILILSRKAAGGTIINVKKNRFSGDIGKIPCEFDKKRLIFTTEGSPREDNAPLGIKQCFEKKFFDEQFYQKILQGENSKPTDPDVFGEKSNPN